MKIQELAIIFVIIILPISIVISAYTQFQMKTINMQTVYDAKLTSATFDAIKAFQLNTTNSTLSELSNSKLRDIEAAVATFKKSIMSTFGLNGYSEDEIDNYIPALVFTMYDGFYIYSPYENTNYLYEYERDVNGNIQYDRNGEPIYKLDADGNKIPSNNNGVEMYGLKPYITYSCRYKRGNDDFVITYSLDNFITIQGMIGGEYVDDEGYLIDGITQVSDNIYYNGIQITAETELKENVGYIIRNASYVEFPYIKLNGTKYYYDDNGTTADTSDDKIFYISNSQITIQGDYKGAKAAQFYNDVIKVNTSGITYYKKAMEFTKRAKEKYNLQYLTYAHAYDENTQLWSGDTRNIFVFNSNTARPEENIECELSNYNQHRLAVIRHTIEKNLSIAISNYNNYSKAQGIEFQMPELKEEEWDFVMNNISLISFVQGLNIGGKTYNGYTIVNNSESKEVIQEENIYILGQDNYYYRIGDNYLTTSSGSNIKTTIPAGRLNLDFTKKEISIDASSNLQTAYYYPLRDYNASYSSIITQNDVTTYDDIYAYISQQNDTLKKAFYTALGREREGTYKFSNTDMFDYNVLVVGFANGNAYEDEIRRKTSKLNEYDYINATYIFVNDRTYLTNYVKSQKNKYKVIIVDSMVWGLPLSNAALQEVAETTNLITISNDQTSLPIIESGESLSSANVMMTPTATTLGQQKIGVNISARSDSSQGAIRFKNDVKVLYEARYAGRAGTYHAIGYSENAGYRWIHSQISYNSRNGNEMKVLERLVYYAMNGL